MDIGFDSTARPRKPAAAERPATVNGDWFGYAIMGIVMLMLVGLVWGGVSWAWNQISGGAAAEQQQIEQAWYSVSPSTRMAWCAWARTGNMNGAELALWVTARQGGHQPADGAVRDFLTDRCR